VDVALTAYQSALDQLFARTTGAMKFGLERTRALLGEMGDPHLATPVLHIAGTNGKGSAVATADALLRARGLRVARYTSPHLIDFRERIVIDGAPIGAPELSEMLERWMPAVERLGASFFEATTAMAFLHFATRGADVALIETGLGGRLDSTNVVDPLAAGVTSIGIDHTEYLGATLEAIAHEKAGIFKKGRPAVIGEPSIDVRRQLARAAHAAEASPVRTVVEELSTSDVEVTPEGTSFRLAWRGEERLVTTPLIGAHQAANFAFTLALLDAAGSTTSHSLAQAADAAGGIRLPGRFQRVGSWIFDVAHNADGARTLAASLRLVMRGAPATVLICVLGDKDWRGMLDALRPVAGRFILTDAPTAPAARRWPLGEAAAHLRGTGVPVDVEPGFERALGLAERSGTMVVVTGSFHTVGDAMSVLQVSPFTG
jgi:dihydrofolate synthase/folylpolyglutamate synthase